MCYELELTRVDRLRLAGAFRHHKRVDYAIDCVLEGQMGRAFADDLQRPTAFSITAGPCWYFAGDAHSPGAQGLLRALPPYGLLMPSPPEWIAAAHDLFQDRLLPFTRYSFSPDGLSERHLLHLLDTSPHRDRITALDEPLAARLAAQPASPLEIEAFDSPADFCERGMGFAALEAEHISGAAYSSLVCSRGIEVSVYVKERRRQRGVGTALASRLLLDCQRQGLRPNWDAANRESYRLARKLGYEFTDAYDAYYYPPE
jgi:GNAT superfamily N-acetyltransferase